MAPPHLQVARVFQLHQLPQRPQPLRQPGAAGAEGLTHAAAVQVLLGQAIPDPVRTSVAPRGLAQRSTRDGHAKTMGMGCGEAATPCCGK